ncbi:MAG: ATP-dependent DNA helicase RecG [Bacteroidales bacterium]|nr:ATP-dependent DNA helicase RecG [Bacteroidales bacterium]
MSTLLDTDIKFLTGVGPQRADSLGKELNIFTFGDLAYFFPYKYVDKSKFYYTTDIHSDAVAVQLKGVVSNIHPEGQGHKQRLVARFSDSRGSIELIWFKGIQFLEKTLVPGKEYIIYGKPSSYNGTWTMAHPEMEDPLVVQAAGAQSNFAAHYSLPENLKNSKFTNKSIQKLQQNLWNQVKQPLPETLPQYLIESLHLMGLTEALRAIHLPKSDDELSRARARLKFEELFYIQLNILRFKHDKIEKSHGLVFQNVGDVFNTFYSKYLPFPLTGAQKRVIREIRQDFLTGHQSNRLIQGDVGSGKTLVALMSMLIAIDNGYQACIMAPTEILAKQHHETIRNFLKDMPVEVALLTGTTPARERRRIHAALQDGSLKILVGTHALIEDDVVFKSLGLAVIDEQHRFGVAQRAKLYKKNPECPPHVLVMTATPIPRTLSMTLYGDLDVSVIDELPPGRKPIKTVHSYDSKRLMVFKFLREQIAEGRQVYIVYPLIEESKAFTYKDLTDGYESITRAFPQPEYNVSIVHGKQKPEVKDYEMQRFVKGETQIMVATTVIEVGVNVPNATIMVIESAEKFGLSQLHQLRGRVGRGGNQSYCILMSDYKLSADARKRLDIMCETTDGFKISEEDLKLRGPGDMDGTQQSGTPMQLRIADLTHDGQLLMAARNAASDILSKDPELQCRENEILRVRQQIIFNKQQNWSRIS